MNIGKFSLHFLPIFLLLICCGNSVRAESVHLQAEDSQLWLEADLGDGTYPIELNGTKDSLSLVEGRALLGIEPPASGALFFLQSGEMDFQSLYHLQEQRDKSIRVRKIPLWFSILPPLIAIALALIFREVLSSLFAGIWTGAFIASGYSIRNLLSSFLDVIEKYVLVALTDSGHMSVILFSLLIGGMVAVISRNGGMAGVVNSLSRYATTAQSSQLVTWLLGVAIFFDDYANTLIVGNTMRAVTDRFRISREKLAYIVDSTAAPVAAVAFITTWIGAELGYIGDGISLLENFPFDNNPYGIFISSLKYSFYPVLTLAFILMLIYSGREFGPMLKAETRARTSGQVSSAANPDEDEPNMEDLSPVKGAPLRWHNAVIPVVTVIMATIVGLLITGCNSTASELRGLGIDVRQEGLWSSLPALLGDDAGLFQKLGKIIGNSDSYVALLWSSLSGLVIAILLTLSSRIMKLFDVIHSMVTGFKTMLPAVLILTLAWSLAITTEQLHTAEFLTNVLVDSLNPRILPMIIFVLAALISFSTGSSWSTMAILYPIAIPTSWAVCQAAGMDATTSLEILLNVISVVLAASVLGDHCSPISDTTILSSLASDCNHIDHVRTQLPYALTVGTISLSACGMSAFIGGGWLVNTFLLLVSLFLLWIIIRRLGKKVPGAL